MKRSACTARLATGLGAVAAVLAASCGDPTNTVLTELNLDRPVDIAFACYGGMRITNGREVASPDDVITTTAQPRESCDDQSPQLTPVGDPPRPKGQEDLNNVSVGTPIWYGFILQSAVGTVALARFPAKASELFTAEADVAIQDADPLTPGQNAISVGEDPVAIAIDRSGCYEVTANAGSCDLSLLDVNSAIAASEGTSTARIRVDRIPVTVGSTNRPLGAKPRHGSSSGRETRHPDSRAQ